MNNKNILLTLSLLISSTISCMDPDNMNIHDAVKAGNINRVRQLIQLNPLSINAIDGGPLRLTPLHLAAENGHKEIAQLLLIHGANIEARNWSEFTPLHLAIGHSKLDVAELLLKHNAQVNASSMVGTPLHLTANLVYDGENGIAEAQLLLRYKANIDATSKNAWTPLHYAVRFRNAELLIFLLQHNADINARNNKLQTPLIMAQTYKNLIIIQILQDWPLDQTYRNRQIASFLVGQHPRVGQDSPVFNLDRQVCNRIAQLVRSEWKHDTVEEIHNAAEQERIYQIWKNNKERALIKPELQLIKK